MKLRSPYLRSALRRAAPALVAVLLIGLCASAVQACPTCKAGLESHDPNQGDLVSAYMWSILFMMSMPFAILGTVGGCMYLSIRRARTRASRRQTAPAAGQFRDALPA
jgi:heme/copper-type cytochrome/quinol oxidase subunit 2